MSGHRSFDELRAHSPERRARIAAYEQAMRATMRLGQLRTARGVTQQQLAERMAVSQEFVSKLERSGDPRLSSIARYVTATGGKLRVVIEFPDHDPVDLAIPPREQQDNHV